VVYILKSRKAGKALAPKANMMVTEDGVLAAAVGPGARMGDLSQEDLHGDGVNPANERYSLVTVIVGTISYSHGPDKAKLETKSCNKPQNTKISSWKKTKYMATHQQGHFPSDLTQRCGYCKRPYPKMRIL
jgi:hypothetical protein